MDRNWRASQQSIQRQNKCEAQTDPSFIMATEQGCGTGGHYGRGIVNGRASGCSQCVKVVSGVDNVILLDRVRWDGFNCNG